MNEQNKPKESERRQATVIFIDIAGFTEMSEKLDAEEVTDITNACFEMMGEIIEFNGGTIDKFIGDNIMALFGVPIAIENSCLENGLQLLGHRLELAVVVGSLCREREESQAELVLARPVIRSEKADPGLEVVVRGHERRG